MTTPPTSLVNLPIKFLAHKIIKSHPKSYNNAPIEMEQDIRIFVKKLKSSNKMAKISTLLSITIHLRKGLAFGQV